MNSIKITEQSGDIEYSIKVFEDLETVYRTERIGELIASAQIKIEEIPDQYLKFFKDVFAK